MLEHNLSSKTMGSSCRTTAAYPFADKAKSNLVEVRRVNTASTISQRDAYKLMLKDYPDVMSMRRYQDALCKLYEMLYISDARHCNEIEIG